MPAGRKPTLVIEPELQDRIISYIKAGAFPERAALAAGIAERTHYLWQAKGLEEREHREAGKRPRVTWQVYLDYAEAVEVAVAQAEIILLERAALGGPSAGAAMTILERRFRDRWSSKANPQLTAPPSAKPPGSVTALDQFSARRGRRRVPRT